MKHEVVTRRRPTNVTLPEELVARARDLNISLSKACEAGLSAAVVDAERQRWKVDNAAWVEAHRRWVEENPLPLERYRLF